MTNSKDSLLSVASHAQDPFQRSEAEGEKRDEHCVPPLCMLNGNFVWVVAAVAHHMWDVLSSHMYSASILYRICCQAIGGLAAPCAKSFHVLCTIQILCASSHEKDACLRMR